MDIDSKPPVPEIPTLDYATPAARPRVSDAPGLIFGFLVMFLIPLTAVAAGLVALAINGYPRFAEIMLAAFIYEIPGCLVGFFVGIAAKSACTHRLQKSPRRLVARRWGSLIAAVVYLALAIPGCVLYVNYVDDMSVKTCYLSFVLLAGWLLLFPLNADRILLREAEKSL